MKRSLAYITAAWRGDPAADMEQAAHYCRVVYDAGYSPICPMLYLPLFLNDAVSTWAVTCSGAPVCWWYAGIPSPSL